MNSPELPPLLSLSEHFVLLDDSRAENQAGLSYLFFDPESIVSCEANGDAQVEQAFATIQAGIDRGLHAAGWMSYELGYLLEPHLRNRLPRSPGQAPLVFFGLFRKKMALKRKQVDEWLRAMSARGSSVCELHEPRLNMSLENYVARIKQIHEHILDGNTYQVNYTQKYHFEFEGNHVRLYEKLRARQPTEFSALVNTPQRKVLSLSPELFLRLDQNRVLCRPMKGTAKRGATAEADQAMQEWLQADVKNRAENLMIVDLLRNDLSRLSVPGSVKVPNLFTVEKYETLLQMTSTITAEAAGSIPLWELARKMFPCGSITGAPKIRTMELIQELEMEPRGIYTGSIGCISPDGSGCFNVAIRTLDIAPDGRGEMGVGSGIILDSNPEAEFEECLLKGSFMTGLASQRVAA